MACKASTTGQNAFALLLLMGAASKRARKIRAANEFDVTRLSSALEIPKDGRNSLFAWNLAQICEARDFQLLGQFYLPSRLAEAMRTDDALAVAYENRLAPQRCIPVKIKPAAGARAASIAGEAEALYGQQGVGVHPDSISDIIGCLVDHGVAFGVCVATPRPDGSRIDYEVNYWPIEYVRWDPIARCFKTRVNPETVQPGDLPDDPAYGFVSDFEVPIIHGDGRWVIFQKHEIDPFKKEAALLPAALVWARHAFAIRDWAKGSVSHGNAKVVGEMPEGMALYDSLGNPTKEAQAFATLLRAIASGDTPAGIRPAGSTTDYIVNNSTAWQVWSELVTNGEKAAARIYLGTDGVLGSQGGAPGVDISTLFGVATTRVQGDLACIERGLQTGVIEPWCAMNFGDSSLAPKRCYMMPDADADAFKKSLADRTAAFSAALKGLFDAGLVITQDHVNGLAEDFGVRPPTVQHAAAPVAPAAPSQLRRV